MVNASKNKGTAFESAVVKLARANGFPLAERLALAGSLDKGDIRLCPNVIVECKAYATYSDAQVMLWLGETEAERINAGASHGFLAVKRARKPIEHAWAVELHTIGGRPRPVFYYLADYLAQLVDDGWGQA